MRTLLNIIWFFFGGLPLFLGYLLAGIVSCIFIVTIPAGVACFRIAGYVLWPFGKRVVDQPGAGAGSALMTSCGSSSRACGSPSATSPPPPRRPSRFVGIPLAIANLKMIPITCFPFGKVVVNDPAASIL